MIRHIVAWRLASQDPAELWAVLAQHLPDPGEPNTNAAKAA